MKMEAIFFQIRLQYCDKCYILIYIVTTYIQCTIANQQEVPQNNNSEETSNIDLNELRLFGDGKDALCYDQSNHQGPLEDFRFPMKEYYSNTTSFRSPCPFFIPWKKCPGFLSFLAKYGENKLKGLLLDTQYKVGFRAEF